MIRMQEVTAMTDEEVLLMTAKMIQARNSLRSILGDKYEATIEPCRVLIRVSMKHRKCNAVVAATDLSNAMLEAGAGGMVAMKLIAACADVLAE